MVVETTLVDPMVQRVEFINNNLTKDMACHLLHLTIMLHPQLLAGLELLHCTAVTVPWAVSLIMDVLEPLNLRRLLKPLEVVVLLVVAMMLSAVDLLIKVKVSSTTTPSKVLSPMPAMT